MGFLTVCARVQAEGFASGLASELLQPTQHCLAIATRTLCLFGYKVVDIQRAPCRQNLHDAKTGRRDHCSIVFKKREPVTLGLLGPHAADKLRLQQVWPQMCHHWKAALNLVVGLGQFDLAHRQPSRSRSRVI